MSLLMVTHVFADEIPPFYFQTVVAIGRTVPPSQGQPGGWVTEASGFFYGYLVKPDADTAKKQYAVFLVTNRHVLAGRDSIEVRLDPDTGTGESRSFLIPLKDEHGAETWFALPDTTIDIAVVPINIAFVRSQGLQSQFILSDTQAKDRAKLKDDGDSAGETVYILGFPMGITGTEHNYVITRKGSIARISDFLAGAQQTFLIDALIFPGNSGGPVFCGLEPIAIQGTKTHNNVMLIGLVRAYIPYVDVAYSQQTMRPRVTFEENSGLAEVVPVDQVNETITEYERLHPPVLLPDTAAAPQPHN